MKRFGYVDSKDKSDNEKLFEVLIFNAAGRAGHQDVISTAKSTFKKWMDGDEKAIGNDVRNAIFALAIHHGTDKEFSYLLNLYTSPPAPSPNLPKLPTILLALGHTQNPSRISQLLELWLDASYQDWNSFTYALRSLSSYPNSAKMVWEFTKENFDALLEKAKTASIQPTMFFGPLLAGLSTSEQLEDVKSFFYDEGRDPSVSHSIPCPCNGREIFERKFS